MKIKGEESVEQATGIKHSLIRDENGKTLEVRSRWLFGEQPCGFTSKRLRFWEIDRASYR